MMWICSRCKTENRDYMEACSNCGTHRECVEPVTPPAAPPKPWSPPRRFPAHVTRRFGIRTMLVITAFYGVLFSILKIAGFEWQGFLYASLFITGVGLGQIFLYHGRKPRTSSVVAGIIIGPTLLLFTMLIQPIGSQPVTLELVGDIIKAWLVNTLCSGIISCGIYGYLVGCLISGIFLFCERKEQEEEESKENATSQER